MTAAFNQMLAQGPTPIKFENPVNQMAQLMQLKNAQQTGVVNQMAIDKGQRQLADQAAYRNMLAQPGFNSTDPATRAQMLGLGYGDDLTALDASAKTQRDLAKTAYDERAASYKAGAPFNGSVQDYLNYFDEGAQDPVLGAHWEQTEGGIAPMRARLVQVLSTPEGLAHVREAAGGQTQQDAAELAKTDAQRGYYNAKAAAAGQGGAGGTLESGGNVQSATPYQTGAYSVITRGGQQKVYGPDGKEVFGEDAARVVREGYAAGAVDQGSRALARQGGVDTGKQITAGYAAVDKMRNSGRIYDQALSAIDQGAQSGAIANLFPSLFAPTINLEYAKNQLGLDVVSGTTFGALSEGELKLAMSQGLPTGLEGPDLKKWIVSKKTANAKLSDYLERQAAFLEGGGSRSNWLKKTGAKNTDAGGETANGQPSPDDAAEVARILGLP